MLTVKLSVSELNSQAIVKVNMSVKQKFKTQKKLKKGDSAEFSVHSFGCFYGSYINPILTSFCSLIPLQTAKIHFSLRRAGTVQITKRAECKFCDLSMCDGSPINNCALIGLHNLTVVNGSTASGSCLFARLLIGWLGDLEQWRDLRASDYFTSSMKRLNLPPAILLGFQAR